MTCVNTACSTAIVDSELTGVAKSRRWRVFSLACGHLGEFDEARQVWGELKDINPNYAFAEHVGRQPFRQKEDVERIADGLRKARLLN